MRVFTVALMVWDKKNAGLFVTKQKVLIINLKKKWAGEEVILYPDLPRRNTEWDLSTELGEGSTKSAS